MFGTLSTSPGITRETEHQSTRQSLLFTLPALLLIVPILLTACGGGGNSETSSETNTGDSIDGVIKIAETEIPVERLNQIVTSDNRLTINDSKDPIDYSISKADDLSLIMVTNSSGVAVYMALVGQDNQPGEINSVTTATSLVSLTPIVASTIKQNPRSLSTAMELPEIIAFAEKLEGLLVSEDQIDWESWLSGPLSDSYIAAIEAVLTHIDEGEKSTAAKIGIEGKSSGRRSGIDIGVIGESEQIDTPEYTLQVENYHNDRYIRVIHSDEAANINEIIAPGITESFPQGIDSTKIGQLLAENIPGPTITAYGLGLNGLETGYPQEADLPGGMSIVRGLAIPVLEYAVNFIEQNLSNQECSDWIEGVTVNISTDTDFRPQFESGEYNPAAIAALNEMYDAIKAGGDMEVPGSGTLSILPCLADGVTGTTILNAGSEILLDNLIPVVNGYEQIVGAIETGNNHDGFYQEVEASSVKEVFFLSNTIDSQLSIHSEALQSYQSSCSISDLICTEFHLPSNYSEAIIPVSFQFTCFNEALNDISIDCEKVTIDFGDGNQTEDHFSIGEIAHAYLNPFSTNDLPGSLFNENVYIGTAIAEDFDGAGKAFDFQIRVFQEGKSVSPLTDQSRFLVVGTDGSVQNGDWINIAPDGTILDGFIYRPDGKGADEYWSGLEIGFEPGAKLVERAGSHYIQFSHVTLKLGRFDTAPISLNFSVNQELSIDSVSANDLRTLLGIENSDALMLMMGQNLAVEWYAGSIGVNGLGEALFLPPGLSNLFGSDYPVTFNPKQSPETGEFYFEATFKGTFTFNGVELLIPRQNPWTFNFWLDGHIALSGEANITLPNGVSFRAGVSYGNNAIQLELAARNLTLNALGSFAELIPTDPTSCVPTTADDQQMNIASDCLEAFRNSYQHFATGAVVLDDINFDRDLIPVVTPDKTVGAALEAMAWRGLAQASAPANTPGLTQSFVDELASLTGNGGRAVQASYELPDAIAWQDALLRIQVAASNGTTNGLDWSQLDTNRSKAEQAVIATIRNRLQTASDEELLNSLQDVIKGILKGVNQGYQNTTNVDPLSDYGKFLSLVTGYVNEFSGRYFAGLGIQKNTYSAAGNTQLAHLDRYSTALAIRDTFQIWSISETLALEMAVLPVHEAIAQLVEHLATLHEADLSSAPSGFQSNYELIQIIVRERLRVWEQWEAFGVSDIDPQLTQIGTAFFDTTVNLLDSDELFRRFQSGPASARQRIDWMIQSLEFLNDALAYVPARGVGLTAPLVVDINHLIDDFLSAQGLDSTATPQDWVAFIRAGVRGDELGRNRFDSIFADDPTGGEAGLIRLVRGLVTVSGADPGTAINPQYAFLDEAGRLLNQEIRKLEIEVTEASLDASTRDRRRAIRLGYLRALGELAAGYQQVARRLYSEASGRLGTIASLQDMLLPGNIKIDEIAGVARLDLVSNTLYGRFSGSVQLPKFISKLTVQNASFDTLGNVDFSAFGETAIPGQLSGEGGQVAIRIPERRPLSIGVRSDASFSISGGTDLILPSGDLVSGFLSIDDPDYVFELAFAGSARIKLINKVSVWRPQLDAVALENLTDESLAEVNEMLTVLLQSYENVFDDDQFGTVREIWNAEGMPPEFVNREITVKADALNTASAAFGNDIVLPLLNAPENIGTDLRSYLRSVSDDLRELEVEIYNDPEQMKYRQVLRLRQVAQMQKQILSVLKKANEEAILGDEVTTNKLTESAINDAIKLEQLTRNIVEDLQPGASPRMVYEAHQAFLLASANLAAIGNGAESADISAPLANGIHLISNAAVQNIGYEDNGCGLVATNPSRFEMSTDEEVIAAIRVMMALADEAVNFGLDQYVGIPNTSDVASCPSLNNNYLNRAKELHNQFWARKIKQYDDAVNEITRADTDASVSVALAYQKRLNASIWLNRLAAERISIGFELNNIAQLQQNFADALNAINNLPVQPGETPRSNPSDYSKSLIDNAEEEYKRIYKNAEKLSVHWLGEHPRFPWGFKALNDFPYNNDVLLTLDVMWSNLEANGLLDQNLKADILDSIKGWLTRDLQKKKQTLVEDPDFEKRNLTLAIAWAETSIAAVGFLESWLPQETALKNEWQLIFNDLSVEIPLSATAHAAWWTLSDYGKRLSRIGALFDQRMGTPMHTAIKTAGRQVYSGLNNLVELRHQALTALSLEELDITLPGDLTINRLFGRLEFNRLTAQWRMAFGGAAQFPQIDVAFSLNQAMLASNGDFSFALSTEGPLPFDLLGFGISDEFDLELNDVANNFLVTGNLLVPAPLTALAAGKLTRKVIGGGLENYDARIAYQFQPGANLATHSFHIETIATGDIIKFTDDLYIFRSGFMFDLVTEQNGSGWQPQTTSLGIKSQVGLLAKAQTLPMNPSINDFQLVFEGDAGLAYDANTDTTTIYLGDGDLLLPPMFKQKDCTVAGKSAPNSGRGRLSFTGSAPVSLKYHGMNSQLPSEANTLELGVPQGSSLDIENIGFGFGGSEALWVDVCQVSLQFALQNGRPSAVLANAQTQISVPMPGERDPLKVGMQVSNWDLNGLPAGGNVYLAEDLLLFDSNGLKFKANENSAIALNTVNRTELRVTGVFSAETNWFTDSNGQPLAPPPSGTAQGELVVVLPDDLTTLSLDDFDFQGLQLQVAYTGVAYISRGPGGLAVVNPRLSLINLQNALAPTVDTPFELEMDLGLKLQTGTNTAVDIHGKKFLVRIVGYDTPPLVGVETIGSCLTVDPNNPDDPNANNELVSGLPFYLTKLCIDFVNSSAGELVPLFPPDPLNSNLPGAFAIDNLSITLSAGLDLQMDSGASVVKGEVKDAKVNFNAQGNPEISIDGIGIGVDLTEYLGAAVPLGGTVYLSGLQTANYYLVGQGSVNIKGNSVNGLMAMTMENPPYVKLQGFCFGLQSAEVGIPLGYGFIMTGGRGGLALGNGYTDPCSFVDQMGITVGQDGKPVASNPPEAPSQLPPGSSCPVPLTKIDELQAIRADSLDPTAVALQHDRNLLARRLISEQSQDSATALAEVETFDQTAVNNRNDELDTAAAAEAAAGNFICPSRGSCPPPSLGILAQMHPDSDDPNSPNADRAIIKFTAVDETTLNLWGIDRLLISELFTSLAGGAVPDLSVSDNVRQQFAADISERLRAFIESAIPKPEYTGPKPTWVTDFETQLAILRDQIQLGFFNSLNCGLAGVNTSADLNGDGRINIDDAVDAVYAYIRDAAWAGIPYTDVTIKVQGSFSYSGLSSFASITGGGIVSTSGAVGIVGSVDVLGIPVGKLTGFMNQLDADGNPSPSVCGSLDVGIGPMELGNAEFLADCPNCVENLSIALQSVVVALSEEHAAAVLQQVAPELTSPQQSAVTQLGQLAIQGNDWQKQRILAELLTLPLDGTVAQDALVNFIVDLGNAVSPRLAACGEIRPRLFGFTPSGDKALFGFREYTGPKNIDNIPEGFYHLTEFNFSPLQILGTAVFAGAGAFVPTVDQASAAFQYDLPAFGELTRSALVASSPVDFANQQVENFVDSAAMAFTYEISPLGIELSRSSGRILMPSFINHPDNPNHVATPSPSQQGLPSRQALLSAMLGVPGIDNVLSDTTWRGTPEQLAALFPNDNYDFTGIDLVDDYFPYGGIIGASQLSIPNILVKGIDGLCQVDVGGNTQQPCFAVMLDTSNEPLLRLTAAMSFFGEVGKSESFGNMAMYIPAPRPPSVLNGGFPASSNELFDGLRDYDPNVQFDTLYPIDQAFMTANVDMPLLGLPTAYARLNLNLDPNADNSGRFELVMGIPTNSWLAGMTGGAQEWVFNMETGQQMQQTLAARAEALQQEAADLLTVNDPVAISNFLDRALSAVAYEMPQGQMDINLGSFYVPLPGFTNWGTLDAASSIMSLQNTTLLAYTPRFTTGITTYAGLLDEVRKRGGIGIGGQLTFNQGGLELNATEVEMTLTPNATNPLAPPTLKGSFMADNLTIGGITVADAQDIQVNVTAAPDLFAINASAKVNLLNLGIFTLEPVNGNNFEVAGGLSATVDGSGEAAIHIGPVMINHPAFGPETMVSGTLDYMNGNPSAEVTIKQPELNFNVLGESWLQVTFPNTPELNANLSGIGTSVTEFSIDTLPTGAVVTTFPGATDARKQTVTIGAGATGSLAFNSASGFTLNLSGNSARNLNDFPGAEFQNSWTMQVTESSFNLNGDIKQLQIPGATLESQNGSLLGFGLSLSATGNLQANMDPVRVTLSSPMLQSELRLDGGTYPGPNKEILIRNLTLSSNEPWQARLSVDRLTLDPDGAGPLPTFVDANATLLQGQLQPGPLFSVGRVQFNGLSGLYFNAIEAPKSVTLSLLPGTHLARDLVVMPSGNIELSNGPGGIGFSLPGLTKRAIGNSFNLGSMLDGTALMNILPEGNNSNIVVNEAGLYLELDQPRLEVAGHTILSTEATNTAFSISNTGDFSGTFTTTVPIDLFGSMLQLAAGDHTVSGNITNLPGTSSVDSSLGINIKLPYYNGSRLTTRAYQQLIPVNFDTTNPFNVVWSPFTNPPIGGVSASFNFGWVSISPGGAGQVQLGFSGGDFTFAVQNWDLSFLGNVYNDVVDFNLSTDGAIRLNLPATNYDLGTGLNWIRLSSDQAVPVNLNILNGTINATLPSSTLLSLPGFNQLKGTLNTGLNLGRNLLMSGLGTFNTTWNPHITINGVDFGNIGVSLHRDSYNSPMLFEVVSQLQFAGLAGVNLDILASDTSGSYIKLSGSLEVPIPTIFSPTWGTLDGSDSDGNIELGALDLSLMDDPNTQFQGTGSILGLSYDVGIGTGSSYIRPINIGWLALPLPQLPLAP